MQKARYNTRPDSLSAGEAHFEQLITECRSTMRLHLFFNPKNTERLGSKEIKTAHNELLQIQ